MAKVLGCCKTESAKQIETWIAEFEDENKQKAEKIKAKAASGAEDKRTT